MSGEENAGPPNRQERDQDELRTPDEGVIFFRSVVGKHALELATNPEGRAAGLSVEVWPGGGGVYLRVRKGRELRFFSEQQGDNINLKWEKTDPGPKGDSSQSNQGSLGRLRSQAADDIRAFIGRWLAWRAQGI